jgi:hypothetical protein
MLLDDISNTWRFCTSFNHRLLTSEIKFRLRFSTCKELNWVNTPSWRFVRKLDERFSLVNLFSFANCPLFRSWIRQFLKVSSVRSKILAAEMSAVTSGLDVLSTSRLLVVAGRWLRPPVTSQHETSVVFKHTHPTGQELGVVPLFAHTTTNISAVINSVWAMF